MNISEIKIGDRVNVKRIAYVPYSLPDVDPTLTFTGKVEAIRGDFLILDNPASVNIKNVVSICN